MTQIHLDMTHMSYHQKQSNADHLLIKDYIDSQPIPNLKFHKSNCIGKLSIIANGTELGSTIPKLIDGSEIAKIVEKTLVDTQFEEAFKNTENRIVEFPDSRAILHKWLIDSKFFKNVEQKIYKRPDFICFGSIIALQLRTYFQPRTSFGNWTVFAAKYMDSIFIWRLPHSSSKEFVREYLTKQYACKKFKNLVTVAERLSPGTQSINDYEKHFVIQEVTFGSHQLLLANEVDAEETQKGEHEEPNWAIVTTILKQEQPDNPKRRKMLKSQYLKCWANGVPGQVSKFVVGLRERDPNWTIEKSTLMKMDDIMEKAGIDIPEITKAYSFENRLLMWIKSHFVENNPNLVKKFTWKSKGPKRDRLECFKVTRNLPHFIVDELTGQLSNV